MSRIPEFPLQWPDTMPRTNARASSQFRTGLPSAMKNVRTSLAAFAKDSGKPLSDMAISSNVTLGTASPVEPGVAVWFTWDGMEVCIAVDRYAKVEENLQAIHHVIEARRTELRHGGIHIVRATFRGFQALPAPTKAQTWRDILKMQDFDAAMTTIDMVEQRYRLLAKKAHPDAPGGSNDAMSELNRAKDEAIREIGGDA